MKQALETAEMLGYLSSSRAERRSQMDLQGRVCEGQHMLLSCRDSMRLHTWEYDAQSSPTKANHPVVHELCMQDLKMKVGYSSPHAMQKPPGLPVKLWIEPVPYCW